MGRQNRSRKRRDEMNRIKRERYGVKELQRLKKTLGIIDANGDELMKEVEEIATVKSAKQIKKEQSARDRATYTLEMVEREQTGEEVTIVHEKTGKKHTFNTKTMKDEHGNYPVWYKPRKTLKQTRKLNHARKQRFKQQWTTVNVPL